MKVLVTGANGYIGKHVIDCLLDEASVNEVIAVDFSNSNIPKEVVFFDVNILQNAGDRDLYKKLGEPDVCIHLAWQDGFRHQSDSHIENLYKHYCFLRNMIDSGCKSISVMGTMHEIGYWEGAIDENTPCNPLSHYGIAKNALRQLIFSYIEDKDVSLKWLRAYYILGDDAKNKSVFAKILQLEEEGKETFPFVTGESKYDFISVQELAKQITKASIQNNVTGIINCCTGKPTSLKEEVEKFLIRNNLKIKPEYGAFPCRKYDSPVVWGDNSKINLLLTRF